MIFSRRREAGRHAKAEEAERGSVASKVDERRARRAALLDEFDLPDPEAPPAAPPPQEGLQGPYDFSEAPAAERVDLGSLLLPAVDGVEIRMQAADNGVIQQLILVNGGNALQLGVFAAPRTDGLWEEVREEIRKSLFTDGVAADEVQGRWGRELRARLRTQEGFDELRFIGIDGPRWMVRAVLQGPAAVDFSLAGPLKDCLMGLVVRRDDEARPTREALPLRLPEHMRPNASPEAATAEHSVVPAQPEPEAPQPPRRKPSPRPRRD